MRRVVPTQAVQVGKCPGSVHQFLVDVDELELLPLVVEERDRITLLRSSQPTVSPRLRDRRGGLDVRNPDRYDIVRVVPQALADW